MRPIRVAESAIEDIERQIPKELVEDFLDHDLATAVSDLAGTSALIAHGPGWRFTKEGAYVAGFHLFVARDSIAPSPLALVIYAVDIWLDDFPT